MKKNIILILSIIGAGLLIGSFPLKWIAGGASSDACRLAGFVLVFVVMGFRLFQKEKSDNLEE